MGSIMGFWDEKETKRLFQKLPFSNVPIEKPHIKHLKNIELLHELSFYNQKSKTFERYARSYKIEITYPKDPLV